VAKRRPGGEWDVFAAALGVNIQRIRVERGLNQDDVAYSAGIGRTTYQRLERGDIATDRAANPSLRNVMAVAQALGVDVEDLLPGERPDLRGGR
jgi:transcriptional regulator with XRE-family HTH domain